MTEYKCHYRYEGANIVIVPFTKTAETLENFKKSGISDKSHIKDVNSDQNSSNSSKASATTCSLLADEKSDKIKAPTPPTTCSLNFSNRFPEENSNEDKTKQKVREPNITSTESHSKNTGKLSKIKMSKPVPVKLTKSLLYKNETVLEENKSQEVGHFSSAENQQQIIKDKQPVSKVTETNTKSSQSWASNYMMNIGNLCQRPVKHNLSLNKNTSNKEDDSTEIIPSSQTLKPESNKLDSSSKPTVFDKANMNKNNVPNKNLKMSKKLVESTEKPKTNNRPHSSNKDNSGRITDKCNNKRCTKNKVSKYYIPLEKKPRVPKHDGINENSKLIKHKKSSIKASTKGFEPSKSKPHKHLENVVQKRQKEILDKTENYLHSKSVKKISSNSSKPDSKNYKFTTHKHNDGNKIVTHSRDNENKKEIIKRRYSSKREEAKSKVAKTVPSTKSCKRRPNRIYESDISEDEVPSTIKSIVNDVREISKQNDENTSGLNKFTDLREKLSAKYSKSLSEYIKNRQLKTTQNKENLLKSKRERDNLVISIPNNTDGIKNTDVSTSSKRKKSPKPKKSKKIKLIIKLVCDDETSSSSDDESKIDNKIEHTTTDLSFLDDFNIDEIVECLNNSKSPSQHNDVHDKNSIIATSNDITKKGFDCIDNIYDEDTMDLNNYNDDYTSITDCSFTQGLFNANSSISYEIQQNEDFRYKGASNSTLSPKENNDSDVPLDIKIKAEGNKDAHDQIIKLDDDKTHVHNLIDKEIKTELMETNYKEQVENKITPKNNNPSLLNNTEIIVIDDIEDITLIENRGETTTGQANVETIVIDDDVSYFNNGTLKQEIIAFEENEDSDILDINANNKENTIKIEDHLILHQTSSVIADNGKTDLVNTIKILEIKQESHQQLKDNIENISEPMDTDVKTSKMKEQKTTSIATKSLKVPLNIALVGGDNVNKSYTAEDKSENKKQVVNKNKDIEIAEKVHNGGDNSKLVKHDMPNKNQNNNKTANNMQNRGDISETEKHDVTDENKYNKKGIKIQNGGDTSKPDKRHLTDENKNNNNPDNKMQNREDTSEPEESKITAANNCRITGDEIQVKSDKSTSKKYEDISNKEVREATKPVEPHIQNANEKKQEAVVNNDKLAHSKNYKNSAANDSNSENLVKKQMEISLKNCSGVSVEKPNVKGGSKIDEISTLKHLDDSPKNKLQKLTVAVDKPVDISVRNTYNKAEKQSLKDQDSNSTLIVSLERRMLSYTNEPYTIQSLVHSGKFSKVFSCTNDNGEMYAVKHLNWNATKNGLAIGRMLKNIGTDMAKEDINIVITHHSFAHNSSWCFLMDYYPKNLQKALQCSKKSFHINLVYILAKQLASALLILKRKNIVHSDINPCHILLNSTNSRLKLCGFDRAYYIADEVRVPNIGTCNYRAPEIILGYSAGFEIDVWAMALIIIEMITKGRQLFHARFNNSILHQQMCAFGDMPGELIQGGIFSTKHFVGYIFKKKYGQNGTEFFLKNTYYPNNILSRSLYSAHKTFWGNSSYDVQQKEEYNRLRPMISILTQMLNLHPNYRASIELIYTQLIITDIM